MEADAVDILLDEIRNLREQLTSANVKINSLIMEIFKLTGELNGALEINRQYQEGRRAVEDILPS